MFRISTLEKSGLCTNKLFIGLVDRHTKWEEWYISGKLSIMMHFGLFSRIKTNLLGGAFGYNWSAMFKKTSVA